MPYTIRRKAEFSPAAWAGGSTTELFIYPEGTSNAERNFELRISSATVDLEESVFSDFSGYDRHIAPLTGTMRLEHEGHHSVTLLPCQADSFSGNWTTRSFGKCVDFNLIHRPGWKGSIRGLATPSLLTPEGSGYLGIYALRDRIAVSLSVDGESGNEVLNAGDFLLIACADASERFCLLTCPGPDTECFAIAAFAFR